ncbi:MAG TPA: Ada metal-binding domain-containing protein [Bacillota bacterium]|jgi:hypothetical protein|nr:Ada metal-binding domain-containing protein [Bacillota bacterium]HOL08510.1 Ada metal-binding domain-containing protein [Bacillota bacterium]HPO97009.1 Ada metal-binding domain-containing protein [Bacillota bacterium]
MKLRKLLFFVCLIIFIIPQTYANSTAHLAILDTVNLSGIESVGNKKIAPVIDKLFSETLKKATPETIYNTETTRNLLKKEGLDLYYVARNLCTNEDLVKIGRKIGVNYLAILEIHGYSEISREKFKKNYQLLLGLKVINCSDGSESYYFGEGNHDKKRNEAYVDAVNQLVAAYLQNDTGVDINRNDLIQVVGNRLSKVYHRSDSSHLPKEEAQERFNLRTEAEANEYRACVACFPPYQHFYSRDRVLEEELGAEACGIIEHYYRLLYDAPELLTRVEEVAAPLIKNTIRKDVRYRFRILDTDEIQA